MFCTFPTVMAFASIISSCFWHLIVWDPKVIEKTVSKNVILHDSARNLCSSMLGNGIALFYVDKLIAVGKVIGRIVGYHQERKIISTIKNAIIKWQKWRLHRSCNIQKTTYFEYFRWWQWFSVSMYKPFRITEEIYGQHDSLEHTKESGFRCNFSSESKPIEYFELFFDSSLLSLIVEETNKYAEYRGFYLEN